MAEDLNVGHKVNENNLAAHVSNTFLSIQRVSYDINNQMIFCNYSIAPQYIKLHRRTNIRNYAEIHLFSECKVNKYQVNWKHIDIPRREQRHLI